ncbi:hypothetical protein AVEN_246161-1 [Araneus ventricosus]|uniref:Uncharacterized protein n=1 Tax=Araneus ventricosus TaxID=182803 RepID=A0A4Y2P7L1_ARAVE|nr:hypothetical protein AVEN_246161-1 [Araneus ventricosus]
MQLVQPALRWENVTVSGVLRISCKISPTSGMSAKKHTKRSHSLTEELRVWIRKNNADAFYSVAEVQLPSDKPNSVLCTDQGLINSNVAFLFTTKNSRLLFLSR